MFLDGVHLPALYHFLFGPSVLTAHLIDQIDFYPGGFGVQLGRVTAGDAQETAIKRVILWPRRLRDDQRPNAKPVIGRPAGAQAEPYLTTVVDRLTDETRPHEVPAETLRFQFFATAGKFDAWETSSELAFGGTPQSRVPLEAQYRPARAGEVRIWIVARDERGGVSWTERRLLVTER